MSTPVANSAHISNSACTYSQPLDLAEDRDIQRSHASAPGSLRQTGNKFVNCQVFIQWQSPQQPGSLKHFWTSTFAKLLPGFSLFWKCKTEIKGFQTLGYGGQLLRHTSWSRFLRTFSRMFNLELRCWKHQAKQDFQDQSLPVTRSGCMVEKPKPLSPSGNLTSTTVWETCLCFTDYGQAQSASTKRSGF